MKWLGEHIILEVYDVNSEILDDVSKIREIMLGATQLCNVTVIKSFFHRFSPHGISGIVVIAESHFSIHTWPEYNYAAIDLFTCGHIELETVCNYFKKEFGTNHICVLGLKRGVLDMVEERR